MTPSPGFTLRWLEAAKHQFDALAGDPHEQGRFKQVVKALRLLSADPRHPGLQTHPFHSLQGSRGEKVFEAYAQNQTPGAYRIFWCYGPAPGEITLIAITPHP